MLQRVVVALVVLTGSAHADPSWPVRLNVGIPLGYTWGTEKLNGFTWGFRGSATVYPKDHGGVAVGGFAEILLDTNTDHVSTFGVTGTYPVLSFDAAGTVPELRFGGYAGARFAEGDDRTRLAAGVISQLSAPAYLYEVRLGLRLDGTFDGGNLTSTSVLVDLDLAALLGVLAAANSK